MDGVPATKAGALVDRDAALDIADDARFVSRGGLKLERALQEFGWTVDGLRCLDVGASTGGFTDCLLQRGAAHVTAVDVGYGQFAWRLRARRARDGRRAAAISGMPMSSRSGRRSTSPAPTSRSSRSPSSLSISPPRWRLGRPRGLPHQAAVRGRSRGRRLARRRARSGRASGSHRKRDDRRSPPSVSRRGC